MKYLYELTLGNKRIIIDKVQELCDKDDMIKESCICEETKDNIIQLLYGIILSSLQNAYKNFTNISAEVGLNVAADSSSMDLTRIMLIYGIDTKLCISLLKHFRSGINAALFLSFSNTEYMYKHIESNTRYFDLLELSLYRYLGSITQQRELTAYLGISEEKLMQIKLEDIYSGGIIDKLADNIRSFEELKLQAQESSRLLNEALEHDKLKTEFYSNLSHELRTPLNVILGTLQLVDMYSSQCADAVSEKNKKYYKIMRQNCYRLLRLVNNLIDLTKLDAGYMSINMENQDVVSIITNIAASVSDYIENKGIDFVYYSKISEKTIACDPDKIERIVLNLLSNAAKFTESGGRIQVTLWDENDKLYISVKDNGIGIPKDKQNMVFKRFAQIDKSLSRNYQGSGIGLSLVKSLVEMHDGKIELISDLGKGCEFIIELPVKQLVIAETANKETKYNSNNKIEIIRIEFSDIYS